MAMARCGCNGSSSSSLYGVCYGVVCLKREGADVGFVCCSSAHQMKVAPIGGRAARWALCLCVVVVWCKRANEMIVQVGTNVHAVLGTACTFAVKLLTGRGGQVATTCADKHEFDSSVVKCRKQIPSQTNRHLTTFLLHTTIHQSLNRFTEYIAPN